MQGNLGGFLEKICIIFLSLALFDIYSITGMGEDCILSWLYLLKKP